MLQTCVGTSLTVNILLKSYSRWNSVPQKVYCEDPICNIRINGDGNYKGLIRFGGGHGQKVFVIKSML